MVEPEHRRIHREKADKNQKEADRKNDAAAEKSYVEQIVGAINSVVERIDRQQNENTPEIQWEHKWRKREVWGLWIAAGVGLIAIVVSSIDARQARTEMRGQLDEMRAEQRAWVSVQQTVMTEPLRYDQNGIRITLQFALKNTGKNPGAATYIALKSSTFHPPSPEAVCAMKPVGLGVTVFSGDSLGMGEVTYIDKTEFVQGTDFRPKNIPVIRPGITACVIYQDAITKKWHHTPYSYVIQMKAPRPGRGCCAILVEDGDMPENELAILQWPLMGMGPD